MPAVPIALTIAGSDSGGGAGLQADLKAFLRFGAFGTTVVTALTAQNTLGVRAVHPAPAAFVRAQFAALAEDLPPAAVKSGMLADAALVALVAEELRARRWAPYVLDPVMLATSGDRLLAADAEAAVRERLLPLATLVTPNLDEAALLVGFPVTDEASMRRAGQALLALGARAALVKGGHLPGDRLVDVLVTRAEARAFAHDRIVTRAGHGTGCTLSAAITAGLARGRPLATAVEDALAYVQRGLREAPGLGAGAGPLAH
ncbi:MAG: bifunctional hydroxymethylpyrimidine kinase/phosphomethylpyrimidine kinase [Gemmatimonadales bacterium]|nr:bifunctional hydroxymethylpyrimidine kinase/phosphomethylpyrimidine kinase [Gemmatimonadales bacterium]